MDKHATKRDVIFWGCLACSMGADTSLIAALFLGTALLVMFTGRN